MAQSDFLLLVDPVGDQALPVSPRAFERILAPKPRVMARNCVALFLTAEGAVLHIEDIRPADTGALSGLGLWFGRPVPARFQLEAVAVSLEDLQTMVIDCATYMRARRRRADWWLTTADLDEVQATVRGAVSLAALHAAIPWPAEGAWEDLL